MAIPSCQFLHAHSKPGDGAKMEASLLSTTKSSIVCLIVPVVPYQDKQLQFLLHVTIDNRTVIIAS